MILNRDLLLAKRLQKEFNEEAKRRKENNFNNRVALKPFQENLAVTDAKLEYIDPNPDIHALFLHFNNMFFWKKLLPVEVKWSPRMTSCAGICCYQGRGGLCSIRLSLPLLKLRPRKDLVETLLHEMIHAYLFVTHNNRDRDGHGPEFHKHMNRINKIAGTKITVYHTFHDEVKSYQQHWWKCQGPCQKRPPYFGMVRRSMNRAPGPNDTWWSDHQASCGGMFVKVREPEGYNAKKKGKGGKTISGKGGKTATSNKPDLPRFIGPKKTAMPPGFGISGGEVKTTLKSEISDYFSPSKSGSSLVVTQGSKSLVIGKTSTSRSFVPFSGIGHTLGGGNSMQRPTLPNQHLLSDTKRSPSVKKDLKKRSNGVCDDVSPVKRPRKVELPSAIDSVASSSSKPPSVSVGSSSVNEQLVRCPVCNCLQNEDMINAHLDDCIASQSQLEDDDVVCLNSSTRLTGAKESWYLECPGCRDKVIESEFDDHLNSCEHMCGGESLFDSPSQDDSIALSSDDRHYDPYLCTHCPICGQSLSGSALDVHLNTCLSSIFINDEDSS